MRTISIHTQQWLIFPFTVQFFMLQFFNILTQFLKFDKIKYIIFNTQIKESLMKIQDFICGLFAGWSQILSGQPFDYIKVMYQIETSNKPKSMIDFAKEIYKQHGLLGFYRGSSSLFFGFAFTIGLEFAVFEFSKRLIYKMRNPQNQESTYKDSSLSIPDVGLAGGSVGLSISLITCWVEYAKIQKQLNAQCSKGSLNLMLNEIKNNGFKNITKGLGATSARQVIGSTFYYGMYEFMVRLMTNQERESARTFDYLLSGAVAGLSYWGVSYPIDIIKTQVQNGMSYKSALDSILKSSYRGFSVVFIRSILVNGVSFATYQHSKKLFQLLKNRTSQF